MKYDILETHCVYNKGTLQLVAVVWVCDAKRNDIRATYCINRPCSGYEFLTVNTKVDEHLFQRVAAAGMSLPEEYCKKFFNHLIE